MMHLTIAQKIKVGFAVVVVFLLALFFFLFAQVSTLNELSDDIVEHPYTVSNKTRMVEQNILLMKEMLLHLNHQTFTKTHQEKISILHQQNEQNFKVIKERYLGKKETIETAIKHYKAWSVGVFEAFNKPPTDIHTLTDKSTAIEQELLVIIAFADNKAKFFINELKSNNAKMLHSVEIIFTGVALLLFLIAFTVLKDLTKPLEVIKKMTERILHNDFHIEKNETYDYLIKRQDEAGTLFKSVVLMAESLEQSYEELRNERATLENLLASYKEHLLYTQTDKDGLIVEVSESFAKLSGYKQEELLGRNHSILRHEAMAHEVFEDLWQTITSKQTWHGEIKNRTKEGDFYWVESTISPILDAKGLITGYFSTRNNISNKKALERLSKKLKEKVQQGIEENKAKDSVLFHQAKLAQMGEMISVIAHQWRQPLGAVSSAVLNLKTQLVLNDLSKRSHEELELFSKLLEEKFSNIEGYINILNQTIIDFQGFYKKNRLKQELNVESAINKALDITMFSLKKNAIKLQLDFRSNTRIPMYESELMQTILGILKNAEDNFRLRKSNDAWIKISTFDTDKHIVIRIDDNGGGIDEALKEKMFDAYFTTKEDAGGTGLGLYMSRLIIEKHFGGSINAYNTKEGLCLELLLSLEKEQ